MVQFWLKILYKDNLEINSALSSEKTLSINVGKESFLLLLWMIREIFLQSIMLLHLIKITMMN